MSEKLFIPTKCKVGFNMRSDTYSGRLGYIIYHDGKSWRKEPSWNSWREYYISQEEFDTKKRDKFLEQVSYYTGVYNSAKDKPITDNIRWGYEAVNKCATVEEYLKYRDVNSFDDFRFHLPHFSTNPLVNPEEFDNVPTEGFVLNKKVGGTKYSWNTRQTYTRVYDPRGWEFEISVPNLLFILECTNSIKGKGLEGKFVYSWEGKELVLLPCNTEDYEKSIEYTKLQSLKITSKDLTPGYTYLHSNGEVYMYLGKLDCLENKRVNTDVKDYWGRFEQKCIKILVKKHVFINTSYEPAHIEREWYFNKTSGYSTFKKVINTTIHPNYAGYLDKFNELNKE